MQTDPFAAADVADASGAVGILGALLALYTELGNDDGHPLRPTLLAYHLRRALADVTRIHDVIAAADPLEPLVETLAMPELLTAAQSIRVEALRVASTFAELAEGADTITDAEQVTVGSAERLAEWITDGRYDWASAGNPDRTDPSRLRLIRPDGGSADA